MYIYLNCKRNNLMHRKLEAEYVRKCVRFVMSSQSKQDTHSLQKEHKVTGLGVIMGPTELIQFTSWWVNPALLGKLRLNTLHSQFVWSITMLDVTVGDHFMALYLNYLKCMNIKRSTFHAGYEGIIVQLIKTEPLRTSIEKKASQWGMCSWRDCAHTRLSWPWMCTTDRERHTWQHTHSSVCIINCLGADGSQFVSLGKVQCHSGGHITARHPQKTLESSSTQGGISVSHKPDRQKAPASPSCRTLPALLWY